ncbi:chromosomal protein D1 [Glossina fuscipes]|uniref:Chromosomal protein D1 n=1 Tax=Glossina fuscipes TaxID=7396 RepID=A0A9C6DTX6_9MUSC|nr:chromosomal protein D1 [Glossina fuscipes]
MRAPNKMDVEKAVNNDLDRESSGTVPKKRGRPSKPDTPKKIPTGRGRGRPAKKAGTIPAKPVAKIHNDDVSEEDEGTSGDGPVTVSRGRPSKLNKPKLRIEATGKGRGRPKKMPKPDEEDDDDDRQLSNSKSARPSPKKLTGRGRGRPKKIKNSEDESSDDKNDDEEERRTVGRPPTGGVNLNIERTGRGQGRPKKGVAVKRTANGDSDISKKRGRPAASNKQSYKPTGKPRGRPSANKSGAVNSQDEDDNKSDDDDINKSKTADDLRSYLVSDDDKDNDNDKDNDIDNENDDDNGNDNDDNENENED